MIIAYQIYREVFMRNIFFLPILLLVSLLTPSESKAALILRTVIFNTGPLRNFDNNTILTAPSVIGSISTIFDNSNLDITFNRNPAIINNFSLPFSVESTFEIAFTGSNTIFGNPSDGDLSNQQFDFALNLSPSISNSNIQSFFRYFDPIQRVVFSSGNFTSTRIDVSLVPEPTTWMLFLIGFGFVGYSVRAKRSQVYST